MKVILYYRVSSEEQASGGHSLAAQLAKLRAYAALYDLEIVAEVEDAGVSAKTIDRPGLDEALAMLDAGEADGIVVTKLDRLSRSVADWNTLIEGYFGEKAGKNLFSVGDSIDTRTAAGRLVLNILMSVAQWEREAIGERTRDVLRHKIANGERVGRVRYGYALTADGRLVEDENEQAGISTMKALRAEGRSLRQIAAKLDGDGFPTKDGRPWAAATIKRILERTAA